MAANIRDYKKDNFGTIKKYNSARDGRALYFYKWNFETTEKIELDQLWYRLRGYDFEAYFDDGDWGRFINGYLDAYYLENNIKDYNYSELPEEVRDDIKDDLETIWDDNKISYIYDTWRSEKLKDSEGLLLTGYWKDLKYKGIEAIKKTIAKEWLTDEYNEEELNLAYYRDELKKLYDLDDIVQFLNDYNGEPRYIIEQL